MSHVANAIETHPGQPRSRMLWLVLGALVVGQLFAFWLLCSHQVRKAEARSNEALVQQMAMTDCLQYIPGSTIASCSMRIDPAGRAASPVDLGSTVPVSFSYR